MNTNRGMNMEIRARLSNASTEDKQYVLDKVSRNGILLRHVSNELKDDKEVVLAAVAQRPRALQYASQNLRNGDFYAYLESLNKSYSVPVAVFTATVLFGSGSSRCDSNVLQKINALGPEGAEHFKKNLATFAGVRCAGVCPVPWSSVCAAKQNCARYIIEGVVYVLQ